MVLSSLHAALVLIYITIPGHESILHTHADNSRQLHHILDNLIIMHHLLRMKIVGDNNSHYSKYPLQHNASHQFNTATM